MILHPEFLLSEINNHHRELMAEAEESRLFNAIRRSRRNNERAGRGRLPVSSTRARHA